MSGSLKREKAYRILFLISALYDFILGMVFFFFTPYFFEEIYHIAVPIYPAFYKGGAAFVFVMGIGFYFVFLNMYKNIDIVKVGITFKCVYTALAFYYVFIGNMPWVFSVFGFLDIIFLIFFFLFLRDIKREIH